MYRGVKFHFNLLNDYNERLIRVKREVREELELDWLTARLKGMSACFFDVGANIGLYTVVLAKQLSSDSTVVAVECNPVLLARLYRNLASNDLG